MSVLANVKLDDGVQEENLDTLGGGGKTLDTDLYKVKLGMCYADKSSGGATFIHLSYTAGGQELSENIYITNKNGSTTYKDGEDKKRPLPGFSQMTALCQLAVGKPVAEMVTETRVAKVYNAEAKGMVNTQVQALIELMDKELVFGIQRCHANKQKLANGKYIDTNDKRTYNQVALIANSTGFTYDEVKNKATVPEFATKWVAKNQGQDYDRFKPVDGAPSNGTPVAAPASNFVVNFG